MLCAFFLCIFLFETFCQISILDISKMSIFDFLDAEHCHFVASARSAPKFCTKTRAWGVLALFVDPIREGFPFLRGQAWARGWAAEAGAWHGLEAWA